MGVVVVIGLGIRHYLMGKGAAVRALGCQDALETFCPTHPCSLSYISIHHYFAWI